MGNRNPVKDFLIGKMKKGTINYFFFLRNILMIAD